MCVTMKAAYHESALESLFEPEVGGLHLMPLITNLCHLIGE